VLALLLESCSPRLHRLARGGTLTAFGVSAWVLAAGPVQTIVRPCRARGLGLLTDSQPLADVRDQVVHQTSLRLGRSEDELQAADELGCAGWPGKCGAEIGQRSSRDGLASRTALEARASGMPYADWWIGCRAQKQPWR
jgi:hypothetical protein